jgi:cysteine synthase A
VWHNFKPLTATLMRKPTALLPALNKIEHLWHLVGNTPMIGIEYEYKGQQHRIYAKCEHYNLTGSIKDRMALYILQQAYKEGRIQPGNRIVEATSGNTGISFAAIGRTLGHPVTIIMPDWLSRERTDIIRSLGADIQLVSKQEGGFLGSIRIAEKMAAGNRDIFLPQQFENWYNCEAHAKTTAPEIWSQLSHQNLVPAAFIAGVGTGGTIMGMNTFFKEKNTSIKVHPLEPMESPTLSTGYKNGSHRIQGISDEFIPAIVRLEELDPIVRVSDGDAILMAQKMAAQLGLGVGISSGANIAGAIKIKNDLPDDAVVVTILPDSNKKYLSTDLLKKEYMRAHYVTLDTNFLDYLPIPRNPHTSKD